MRSCCSVSFLLFLINSGARFMYSIREDAVTVSTVPAARARARGTRPRPPRRRTGDDHRATTPARPPLAAQHRRIRGARLHACNKLYYEYVAAR